jgi:predicted metal-dependent hydrolase
MKENIKTRKITIGDTLLQYELHSSPKSKALRLSIFLDGRVSVSMPLQSNPTAAEDFLKKKSTWIIEKLRYFKKCSMRTMLPIGRKQYLKNKELARVLVNERLIHFNQFYFFAYRAVAIRDQKSRWGSCSKRGNLNFNYKIVLIDSKLADYIVVHELCHLGEFNHSKNFWKLVERTIPDYKILRERLKYGKLQI